MLNSAKPLASLSLDLDNRWSYLKTHGDAGWESYPTYLPTLVPRVLDFLRKRKLAITFFVVGQDAVRAENHDVIRAIAEAGHEIGNHSFNHEPWLHLFSEPEINSEISRTEHAIIALTGQRSVGFRGPGFSYSPATLRVLARRGYQYDASTLPTFLGPLARAYYFMTAKLSPEEKQQRAALFGKFSEGFRSNKPYLWTAGQGGSMLSRPLSGPAHHVGHEAPRKSGTRGLLEIPVTTLPIFRTPIHVSYLLYLGCYSPLAARSYFRTALQLCRWTGTAPSLLLHPLDFLGMEDAPDLAFFPAMNLPKEVKLARVHEFVEMLTREFEVVPLCRQAASILGQGRGVAPEAPELQAASVEA